MNSFLSLPSFVHQFAVAGTPVRVCEESIFRLALMFMVDTATRTYFKDDPEITSTNGFISVGAAFSGPPNLLFRGRGAQKEWWAVTTGAAVFVSVYEEYERIRWEPIYKQAVPVY